MLGWPRASWNSTSFVLGIVFALVVTSDLQCFYGVELFPVETTFFDSGQMKTMLYPVDPSQLHFNLKVHI